MFRLIPEHMYQLAQFIQMMIEKYGEQNTGRILEAVGQQIKSGQRRKSVKPATQFFVSRGE